MSTYAVTISSHTKIVKSIYTCSLCKPIRCISSVQF